MRIIITEPFGRKLKKLKKKYPGIFDNFQIRESNIMQQKPVPLISETEYLEGERLSEIKHEYYQGEIFAMAGASERHNRPGYKTICKIVLPDFKVGRFFKSSGL